MHISPVVHVDDAQGGNEATLTGKEMQRELKDNNNLTGMIKVNHAMVKHAWVTSEIWSSHL